MDRKFVLSASVVAIMWAGITIAEACSGCGCVPAKKADPVCPDGVCAITSLAAQQAHSHAENLSSDQMKAAVASGKYIILDARGDKYFNGELISGAKRMASATAEADILEALPNKDAEIITYCSNTKCPASKKLAEKLKSLGYTHVQEYPEGLAGWKAAGHAVDTVK